MLNDECLQDIAEDFYLGCLDAVEVIKDNTPIDTKRLYTTVRTDYPEIKDNQIKTRIELGGLRLKGILREQTLERDVNYAKYVEARDPFVRPLLSEITKAIIKRLK